MKPVVYVIGAAIFAACAGLGWWSPAPWPAPRASAPAVSLPPSRSSSASWRRA